MERLKIEEIGYGGEGAGKLNGKVCFAKFALPGEIVQIEITKNKKWFCEGALKAVLEPSPRRVKPLCPYFSVCGGCDFQHVSYSNELEIKKEILSKQLNKIGQNIPVKVVASGKEYFYRNKIKLVNKNGLGYHDIFGNIVLIENCPLAEKQIDSSIGTISQFLKTYNLPIDFVEIKVQNNVRLVNFFAKRKIMIDVKPLATVLDNTQFFLTVQNKSLLLFDSSKKDIINPNVFHQVNNQVADALYKRAVQNIAGMTVANCYSGAGLFSAMLLTNGAKKVFGLELGKNEHNEAERLKKSLNLDNLTNIQGDCAKTLQTVAGQVDIIIVDPPRAGMSEKVCQSIDNSKAKSLIYISCNHATFTRDCGRLKNYQLKKIEIFDMFPKTANFEIFAILCRK